MMGRRAQDQERLFYSFNLEEAVPEDHLVREIAPERASRAVKEYLATLDDPAYGTASEVTPKFISPSDPAA